MTTSGRTGTLTWYTVGEESVRPLVLIHALGGDSEMWEAQVPELSLLRRVVMVDLPGHGNSIAGPGPYTVQELGEDILDVVTIAGTDRFDLCGMSLGGFISLWIAAHAPDRVMALVASNTAARIGTDEIWQARIDAVTEGGIEAVSEQALRRFFTSSFASKQPDVFDRTSRTLLATDPSGYAACCAALRDGDLREVVGAINCPTLVIGGSQDISTPPEDSAWLHEHIAGSTLHILEGAPHFSNLEQPEAWTEAVTEFLERQGAV